MKKIDLSFFRLFVSHYTSNEPDDARPTKYKISQIPTELSFSERPVSAKILRAENVWKQSHSCFWIAGSKKTDCYYLYSIRTLAKQLAGQPISQKKISFANKQPLLHNVLSGQKNV